MMLDQVQFTPGLHSLPKNTNLSWSATMHKFEGTAAMGDGSVQQLSRARLVQVNKTLQATNNVLLFP